MGGKGKKISEEQIKKDIKDIVAGAYPEEAEATIGENRGQLFIRIPKIVTQRLGLKKGAKILFRVYNHRGTQKVDFEVPK